jgi:hypothetical protein
MSQYKTYVSPARSRILKSWMCGANKTPTTAGSLQVVWGVHTNPQRRSPPSTRTTNVSTHEKKSFNFQLSSGISNSEPGKRIRVKKTDSLISLHRTDTHYSSLHTLISSASEEHPWHIILNLPLLTTIRWIKKYFYSTTISQQKHWTWHGA